VKTPDASYRLSYHITVAGEANTFAENRIKQHEVKMAICVLGERLKKKFETILLSNNTVKCHSRFVSRYSKKLVSRFISRFAFSSHLERDQASSRLALTLELAYY
jgi:hypothetical protein